VEEIVFPKESVLIVPEPKAGEKTGTVRVNGFTGMEIVHQAAWLC